MTLLEQYRAATDGAAMFDVSDRALIEVTGRDRVSFLHSFCTNDIKRLQPGEGCEAFVTNVKGRILGHILVFAEPESLWIDSDPGTQSALLQHLDRYVITEDVQFHNRSAESARRLLCGPQAPAALRSSVLIADAAAWPLCSQGDSVIRDVRIRRVPFAGRFAFLIWQPSGSEQLQADLAAYDVAPGSPELLELLRIETMWPRYGVDITEDQLAQEAGRTAQAISFTKGCYLGQEPIARLDALGHTNRELRRIRCDTPGSVAAGAVVLDAAGNAEVGRVSSAAVNPLTNRPVALAMLKTAANTPGTSVRVRTDDGAEIGGLVFGAPAVA